MSKREREPTIDGDELDWVSPSRHVHTVFGRPGEGRRIKRKMNKRARQRTKRELSGNPGELEGTVREWTLDTGTVRMDATPDTEFHVENGFRFCPYCGGAIGETLPVRFQPATPLEPRKVEV